MKFAENLKLVRKQKQMTQTAVAEKLHVSRKTVSSWENERSYPDIGMLVKISDLYDLSIDRLLKGDLGMLEHYEQQAVDSQHQRQVIKWGYQLTVISLFLTYLVTFLAWDNQWVRLLKLAMTVIVLTLAFQYHDYHSWVQSRRDRIRLLLTVMMAACLNFALSWRNIIDFQAHPVIPAGMGNPGAYVLGYISGELGMNFVTIVILTVGAVMVIQLTLQRATQQIAN